MRFVKKAASGAAKVTKYLTVTMPLSAFGWELNKVPDHRARDGEARRQFLFAQPRAGGQAALQDVGVEAVVDPLGGGAWGGVRVCGIVRCHRRRLCQSPTVTRVSPITRNDTTVVTVPSA